MAVTCTLGQQCRKHIASFSWEVQLLGAGLGRAPARRAAAARRADAAKSPGGTVLMLRAVAAADAVMMAAAVAAAESLCRLIAQQGLLEVMGAFAPGIALAGVLDIVLAVPFGWALAEQAETGGVKRVWNLALECSPRVLAGHVGTRG